MRKAEIFKTKKILSLRMIFLFQENLSVKNDKMASPGKIGNGLNAYF